MSQVKTPDTPSTGLDLVTVRSPDTDVVLLSGLNEIKDIDGVYQVSVVYNTANNSSPLSGAVSVPITTFPSSTFSFTLPRLQTTYYLFLDVLDNKFRRTSRYLASVRTGSLRTVLGRGVTVDGALFTESSKGAGNLGAGNLFNGTTTGAVTQSSAAFPHYFAVQFPTSTTISKYRMWADIGGSDPAFGDTPKDWTLQGTNTPNDAATWTTIDTRVNAAPPSTFGAETGAITIALAHAEYPLATPAAYTNYRFVVTDTVTTTTRTVCRIGEVEFMGPAVSASGEPEPTPEPVPEPVPEPPK